MSFRGPLMQALSLMARVNLERNTFHGEWNYVIKPNVKAS
jgi:hypothetical protein